MKQIIYPAIFHKDPTEGYWVEFPDLPGCVTEGDTVEEAFLMAGDVLVAWFSVDDNPQIFPPSDITSIPAPADGFVSLVRAEPFFCPGAQKAAVTLAIERGLERRNLNRNQAATILDIDRSYFSHIISGHKRPSPEMSKRIALLLDFNWELFFD